MTDLQKELSFVKDTLKKMRIYSHACHVLQFDQETICPEKAMEEQGETFAFLENEAFKLKKTPEFISAVEYLYKNASEASSSVSPLDSILIKSLYRSYLREKNITEKMNYQFSLVFNKAFYDWTVARSKADFSLFEKSLNEVRNVNLKQISLQENALPVPYDNLLDVYERGLCTSDLDEAFERCKQRLIPLLKKIQNSKKKIRTDFLSRKVTEEQQKKMAEYLLKLLKFDFTRGAFTTSEHPFTDTLAHNDIRVTTHYYENMFCSSIFSIIHECGHALFEQNQPEEDFEHFIEDEKTLGQHESVSRFYENRIARSKAFIHLIYPEVCRIFPDVMHDVSERELYEAINEVKPSLIRTEADEFTYTFHIIIRYEIEKILINESTEYSDIIHILPEIWRNKYREYLGIEPESDREGILQDVHWASGFGYFSTYAVGNMYNAMYYNLIKNEINLDKAVADGRFDVINDWMKENVWKNASRLDAKSWIKEITGRSFTPDDFLDYLEEKYTEIYEL